MYCIHKFRDSPMTVYSMSRDLETGNIVWCRNTVHRRRPFLHTSAAIAGVFADVYKDEALNKIPTFES